MHFQNLKGDYYCKESNAVNIYWIMFAGGLDICL